MRECQIRTFQVENFEVAKESTGCDNPATLKHNNIWMCDFHYDALHPDGVCECVMVDSIEDARVFDTPE